MPYASSLLTSAMTSVVKCCGREPGDDESIVPSEVRVRVYDGLALAMGRSQMRVRNASGVSSFDIRFTEVYVRREGRWLLTAWEATRVSS